MRPQPKHRLPNVDSGDAERQHGHRVCDGALDAVVFGANRTFATVNARAPYLNVRGAAERFAKLAGQANSLVSDRAELDSGTLGRTDATRNLGRHRPIVDDDALPYRPARHGRAIPEQGVVRQSAETANEVHVRRLRLIHGIQIAHWEGR